MLQVILVIFGALLQVSQVVPYLIGIAKGTARPNIVSWITWMLLTVLGSAAAFSVGDWQTGVVVGASALGTASVVVLGLWRGYAKLTKLDICCQIAAVLGFATWPLLNGPLVAVIVAVAIDAVACVATFYHAYRQPQEEVWATYAMGLAGALCGLFALHGLTIINSLYLFYLVVADAILVSVILWRQHAVARQGAKADEAARSKSA